MAKMNLRAFEIVNKNIGKPTSGLFDQLKEMLSNSKATGERRMVLNTAEENSEEDLISHYSEAHGIHFCTMMRIAPGKDVQHISEQFFKKPSFTIDEIQSTEVDGVAIYKDHYYFGIAGDFIVTNLRGNTTITRLQTYLNWYLNKLYEINPIVSTAVSSELANVKSITVSDPVSQQTSASPAPQSTTPSTGRSIIDLRPYAMGALKHIFKDARNLEDVELANLVSAKLIIEFNKPKKDDSEAVKKAFSALLKPVSDLDHVQINTRDGKKHRKGSEILRTKTVDIDLTDSGKISENTVIQKMAGFIQELENDKTNTA